MSQLLTDAVCGETVPAWGEAVDELDAEIERCETLGWHAGDGWEWVAELRLYRAAIDDQRDAVARRDTALAACGIDDPAGFAPASLDDIDDPAVMVWAEACAEVWGATDSPSKRETPRSGGHTTWHTKQPERTTGATNSNPTTRTDRSVRPQRPAHGCVGSSNRAPTGLNRRKIRV